MTDRPSPTPPPEVVVKLEIRVPVVGGAPSVRYETDDGSAKGPPHAQAKTAHPRAFLLSGMITCPRVSSPAVPQGFFNGFVCAKGTAVQSGLVATDLYAKIYFGRYECDDLAASHPGSSTYSKPDSSTGKWQIDQLLGVIGYPFAFEHTCAVWATFDGTEVCETSHFLPDWGNATDCTYPYPYPQPGPSRSGSSLPGLATLAASTLPTALGVKVAGFGGPLLQGLNGLWKLSLQRGDGHSICYSNGGCGKSKPRWELRGDVVGKSPWQLQGMLQGQSVTYACDAAAFKPLAANRLAFHACAGDCDESIPMALTVAPA